MANNQQLKDSIRAVIKQNGNEEITGNLLQQALIAMIDALGMGYQFMGEAKPETNPAPTDARVMYIAIDSGTYSNFVTPPIELDGSKIAIFLYSSAWSAILLNVPNNQYIANELNGKVDKVLGKGLSTNDYTDADKLRVVNAVLTSDIVDSLGDGETKVISQAAMTEILLNYAQIDGYYSSLIAGAAENLVGRGSVPALFTFRTTGGTADVGSGTAQIKKLYGNSIVFNQLVNPTDSSPSGTYNGVVVTNNNGVITMVGTATAVTYLRIGLIPTIAGHKMLFVGAKSEISGVSFYDDSTPRQFQNVTTSTIITASGANVGYYMRIVNGTTVNATVSPQAIDLTLMFGQGKEPATVEEFEALYYLNYYAHNPGAIKNTTAIGIKTTGFNQWDEIAELGGINAQGQNVNTFTDRLRGKNYIPVFPQTTYYFKTKSGIASGDVFFYDANKTFISALFGKGNNTFITPSNCHYIRIALTTYYGTTYNNDVCINLSWSGYRNGEYEPYWSRIINLPLTTMTGKLNGEGESVVIAPDGWMSAGDARFVGIIENGMLTKVEKHVKQVDLGTLTWTYSAGALVFVSDAISGMRQPSGNYDTHFILSSKYITSDIGVSSSAPDKSIYPRTVGTGAGLGAKDTAYTDAAAFKAAMDGVKLNYGLATPEVYVLDEPINMNYSEDDFGTEERLPADTADNVSAPIFFDVQYPMNAVDILRRLGVNYIKKESMDHILQAFVNAGIIGSYSLTYNATNDDYDCVVTEPVQP